MKLDFEGATWQVEFLDADMAQADVIASYTGLSLLAWYKSLTDIDSVTWNKSVRCLYWLMREQNPHNGGSVPIGDTNFVPLKLFAAFNDAMAAEGRTAAAEEDPTLPGGGHAAADSTPPLTPAG